MEKIIILVLIAVNVQFVASCSSEKANECATAYNNCVIKAAENETALYCYCYGLYALCLLDNGCFNDTEYRDFVESCANSGCTRQQCLGGADAPVDVPVTFTPESSSCDLAAADVCVQNYISCSGTQTHAEICNCYGPYLYCYFNVGCLTLEQYDETVQYCELYGCSTEQCLSPTSSPISHTPIDAPVDAPVTFTPVASSSCDLYAADACTDNYISCTSVGNGTLEEICNCYGPYLYCYYSAGCLTPEQYDETVRSCELYGCSAEQCLSQTRGPISHTPIDAPFSTPYSDPEDGNCVPDDILACYNNLYQPCVSGLTNSSDACDCYGPYLYCLYEIHCYNGTGYEQNINDCVQYGCSYQQCSNTGVTPIEPPSTSTPISAPFSAPTTVICLQPWELVLIVVGSVLAGVGIAAIIGVIVYLSRGRSGVKKTNKYAKLQRY